MFNKSCYGATIINDGTFKTLEIAGAATKLCIIPRKDIYKAFSGYKNDISAVYVLYGEEKLYHPSESRFSRRVYIGETANIVQRLEEHDKSQSKKFWNVAYVFYTLDNSIGQVRKFIEAELIKRAKNLNNAKVCNTTEGIDSTSFSQYESVISQIFISQILQLLDLASIPFFNYDEKTYYKDEETYIIDNTTVISQKSKVFLYGEKECSGKIRLENNGECTILKDSEISKDLCKYLQKSEIHSIILNLEEAKKVEDKDDVYILLEDVVVKNVSTAAKLITGKNVDRLEIAETTEQEEEKSEKAEETPPVIVDKYNINF